MSILLDHQTTPVSTFADSHLNWTVSKRPMQYQANIDGDLFLPSDSYAVVRDDTNEQLGTVKASYQVIQNESSWQAIIEPLEALNIDYKIMNANSLDNGKMIFCQIELADSHFTVDSNGEKDKYLGYLTMFNSHDGQMCLTIGDTTVRIWCRNTFMQALSNIIKGKGLVKQSASHSGDVSAKIEGMKIALENKFESQILTQKALQELASREMKERDAKAFALGFLKSSASRSVNQANKIHGYFRKGIHNFGNTRYDMFNAVTQFYTHDQNTNDEKPTAQQRKSNENALFKRNETFYGQGSKRKALAFDILQNEEKLAKVIYDGTQLRKAVVKREKAKASK
tara:strand:- start:323 stop:1342 length:1020 start_codon:yes stop_codon:yes gene_type:complete